MSYLYPMKFFLEYIPLILFLALYKLEPIDLILGSFAFSFGGIYSATIALMLSTLVVFFITYWLQKSLSRMQWLVLIAVLLFGSATLLLRSEEILKWKAPVVNWILSCVFLGSPFVSSQPLAQTMFAQVATLPPEKWRFLNTFWAITFFLVGTTNLLVALNFHEYWVDFKVFGSMGMLLVASVAQIIYMYPHLKESSELEADTKDLSNQ